MVKYRVCSKQVLQKDLKLVDARKVISTLNKDNDNEELVYELEKYTEPKPKVMKTVWIKDKDCPNLKLPTRKRV